MVARNKDKMVAALTKIREQNLANEVQTKCIVADFADSDK
jgi:hypothetical protein